MQKSAFYWINDIPNCIFDEVRFDHYLSILSEIKCVLAKNNYDYEYIKSFIQTIKPFTQDYKGYEIEVFEGLKLIQKAHGIAVLAHPQEIDMSYEEKDLLIKQLKSLGLKGLEVFHGDATLLEISENQKLANENNLLISVGSDYHHPDKNNKSIGHGINKNISKKDCSIVDYFNENGMLEKWQNDCVIFLQI